MDWASEKDAVKGCRLDGGTGPLGTRLSPVVPVVLRWSSLEWMLIAPSWGRMRLASWVDAAGEAKRRQDAGATQMDSTDRV